MGRGWQVVDRSQAVIVNGQVFARSIIPETTIHDLSMYEFVINCYLDETISDEVWEFFRKWALSEGELKPPRGFEQDDWFAFMTAIDWDYPGETFVDFDDPSLDEDDDGREPALSMRCGVPEEALPEAYRFLDAVAKVTARDGFVGYCRSAPEADPALLYFRDGELEMIDVTLEAE